MYGSKLKGTLRKESDAVKIVTNEAGGFLTDFSKHSGFVFLQLLNKPYINRLFPETVALVSFSFLKTLTYSSRVE